MNAPDNQPFSNWPNAPRVLNEVCERLQVQYGEVGIPAEAIMREVERVGGYAKNSILPSDFCYNVINKAPYSFRYRLLIRVGRGQYQYVGPNYAYTGPIIWKPKHGAEQQVGSWSDGDCHLDSGPREASSGDGT